MKFIDFMPTSSISSGNSSSFFKKVKIKSDRIKLKNELSNFYESAYVNNEMEYLLGFKVIRHTDGIIYLGVELKNDAFNDSLKDSIGQNFQKNVALNRLLFVLGIGGFIVFHKSDDKWSRYFIKV